MTVEERRRNQQERGLTMGMIPPQSKDLEESILGTIINDSVYLIDVADMIKPVHMYYEQHKTILQAILKLFSEDNPINMITVVEELRKVGMLEQIGGIFYITDLLNKSSGTKIEYHCRIIIQKYMAREMIRISQETMREAYSDTTDIFDVIEKNQNDVFLTVSDTHKNNGSDINDLLLECLAELDKPPIDGLTGVGSGFKDLDAITGGWQPSDLVIIAARPAMGKTAFVLKCARNAAVKYKTPTVVFSLEMSDMQLANRIISDETNIKLERILKRRLHADEVAEMKVKLIELLKSDLIIDDSPSLNVFELRAKCRRLKKKRGLGLIVIDYLQLMHGGEGKSNNRDNEIGIISRALKSIAKELEVPVLALSQLSRNVEARAVKRPMLSDLRESGNIEQDADQVLFLYRPEYYGVEGDKGQSTVGLCEVIVAKNRNGVTDTIKLNFNGSVMRFKDWYDPKKKSTSDGTQTTIEVKTPAEIKPNHESYDDDTGDLPF